MASVMDRRWLKGMNHRAATASINTSVASVAACTAAGADGVRAKVRVTVATSLIKFTAAR